MLTRGVQLFGHFGIGQRVDLDRDVALVAHGSFATNEIDQTAPQIIRGHEKSFVFDIAAVTSEVIKQLRGISRDVGLARDVTEVFVQPSRTRVVVAGTEVNIAPQTIAVFSHNQNTFGVSLETNDAIHHVHTSAFKSLCPRDIGGFIETSLQFNKHCNLYTTFGSTNEMPRNRAVTAGAVQRHFDTLHARIISGLRQKLFN